MIEDNSICDEVFAFYIYKVSRFTKAEFFLRVLKFISLYREFVNFSYKDKKSNSSKSGEYTETCNPEDVPDVSNEFILSYLDVENETYGYNKEDAIDLTQNFCQWLYDNNFTCSKIGLIN
jgi:hypothetical protein